jgi:predicted nuclease with RNAse H fold
VTYIVGIDCAVSPRKTGLALAAWDAGTLRLLELTRGSRQRPPVAIVAEWVKTHAPVLLALDAPLGWPAALGAALAGHRAGERLEPAANRLFRRRTDEWIRSRLGKRPLEVGADLIARTAHAALALLEGLRERLGEPVPLLWAPDSLSRNAAIEVYPAATRKACWPADLADPEQLARWTGSTPSRLATVSADERDAVICTVAGADFLAGRAEPPAAADRETAEKEGWIWVRGPSESP